jgi:hypothetical protein
MRMHVNNSKVSHAVKDSLRSVLIEQANGPGSLYFMDALKLARMLEKAALDDIQAKATAMGASAEAVDKLKRDIVYMAKSNPIENYRISKACSKASKYLSDSASKEDDIEKEIPKCKPLYNREKYMQRFDAGFDNEELISSSVPNLFVGKREDLDVVISYILDRCEINENCCLHLSLKSFNKKLNKNYKKLRPEEWEGKLKSRNSSGMKSLLSIGSKLKPLEVLVVDELSVGYGPSEKEYSNLKKAHMCYNNCSLSTCARGVVLLAFQEADSADKVKDAAAITSMVDKSRYYECLSDGKNVFLRDKNCNVVLTICKDKE